MSDQPDTNEHRARKRQQKRKERANEPDDRRTKRRKIDADAHAAARSAQTSDERQRVQAKDTAHHRLARQPKSTSQPWWESLHELNTATSVERLGLRWDRTCKNCGILVCLAI